MGNNQSTTFNNDRPSSLANGPLHSLPHSPIRLPSSLATIKIEEGHTRPIPPPLAPSDVRAQARLLDGWITVDNEGDLMVATSVKKRECGDAVEGHESGSTNRWEAGPVNFDFPSTQAASEPTLTLTPILPAKKKRRLMVTHQAMAILDAKAREFVDGPERTHTHFSQPNDQFLESDKTSGVINTDDKAKQKSTSLQESSESSSDAILDDAIIFSGEEKDTSSFSSTSEVADRDDLGLFRSLARLQQTSVSKPLPVPVDRRSTRNSYDLAMGLKEKDESDGAQRSRLLRERKLARPSNYDLDVDNTQEAGSDKENPKMSKILDEDACTDVNGIAAALGNRSSRSPLHVHKYSNSPFSLTTENNPFQDVSRTRDIAETTDDLFSDDDTDLEALLDISQEHDRARPGSHLNGSQNAKNDRQAHRLSGQKPHNPHSRTAVEYWRTQSRHMENLNHDNTNPHRPSYSLEEGENRLRELTRRQCKARPTTVDYTQSTSRITHAAQAPATETDQDLKDSFPLGEAKEVDLEDAQQVSNEHERLKGQQRDLEIIKSALWAIATLRTIDELPEREEKELNEVRKFVSIVIDKCSSDKARRTRVVEIRSNARRRIDRLEPYMVPQDDTLIRGFYNDYLGNDRTRILDKALEKLENSISELRMHRARHRNCKKEAKKRGNRKTWSIKNRPAPRKQVRWADLEDGNGRIRRDIPDGTIIDLDEPRPKPKPKPKGLSRSERTIAILKDRLKVFETGRPANDALSTGGPLNTTTTNDSDSESEVSEEEEGAEYYTGADPNSAARPFLTALTRGFSRRTTSPNLDTDQDIDEINRLENQRQKDEGQAVAGVDADKQAPKPHQSSQSFDGELAIRMNNRYVSKIVDGVTTEGEEAREEVLFDDWTDTESTASSDSDLSASGLDTTAQLYKYTITGQFVGLDMYKDGQEYVFKTFHKSENAHDHVQAIIKDVFTTYIPKYGNRYKMCTGEDQGIFEQLLTIGKNDDIQAKVWVDRQLVEVDLGKAAISAARKQKLANEKDIYIVTWEKTTTTTTATPPAPTNNSGPENDEDDDLFGPNPPPQPTITTTTTTTQCPFEHQQRHSDLASANRIAKEDFMTWYGQFFPSHQRKLRRATKNGSITYNYSGMLRHIDEAKEEELRAMGSWNPFDAQEEVEQKDEGGRLVKEKMRVYVAVVPVQGPNN